MTSITLSPTRISPECRRKLNESMQESSRIMVVRDSDLSMIIKIFLTLLVDVKKPNDPHDEPARFGMCD